MDSIVMKLPSSEPINDPAGLWALQLELLAMAEALFGPRDPSKIVCQPEFRIDGPRIRHTIDECGVFAELSHNARYYWSTVVYELAHETVHLLDPVKGNASFLEEGVAVAFSIHVQERFGVRVQRPEILSYVVAHSLAETLPEGALTSASCIRQAVGKLSDVTPGGLLCLFPETDADVATILCNEFRCDAFQQIGGVHTRIISIRPCLRCGRITT